MKGNLRGINGSGFSHAGCNPVIKQTVSKHQSYQEEHNTPASAFLLFIHQQAEEERGACSLYMSTFWRYWQPEQQNCTIKNNFTSHSRDAASAEMQSGTLSVVWDVIPAGWQLCKLCQTNTSKLDTQPIRYNM